MLSAEAIRSNEDGFAKISERFQQDVADMDAQTEQASAMLEHAFDFLTKTFGKSQEMVVFLRPSSTPISSALGLSVKTAARHIRAATRS